MKKTRLILVMVVVCLAIILVFAPVACAPASPEQEEPSPVEEYVVRFGSTISITTIQNWALKQANYKLMAETDGRMKIEFYPASQLGDEKTMLSMVKEGSLPLMELTSSKMTMLIPWASLFDYPFLFSSGRDFTTQWNAWLRDTVNKDLAQFDVMVAGAHGTGFHAVYMGRGTQPITKVDDLKGYKIRVQSPGIYLEAFKAYGAKPTVIPFAEVFTAMEQGVIDGFTTSVFAGAIDYGFADITEYLSLTDHMYNVTTYFASTKWLDSLPSDLRDKLLESVDIANMLCSEKFFIDQQAVYAAFEAEGVKINRISEAAKDEFRATLGPVYDFALQEYGAEVLDKLGITRP